MGLIAATCPSCGASIQLPEGKDRCFCTFCGNQILTEAAINYHRVKMEGEVAVRAADFDVQAGVLMGYHGASTEVVLPDTVKTIDRDVFKGLPVTSITLPYQVDWLSYDVVRGIPTLKDIHYPYDDSGWKSYDGVLYSLVDRELIVYPANHQAETYTVVGGTRKATFRDNPNLKHLIIEPADDGTLPELTIFRCMHLERIDLPATGVGSLILEKCPEVRELSLPAATKTLRVANCPALARIDCGAPLESLHLQSAPISHFNEDGCIRLAPGTRNVHIEGISAKRIFVNKEIETVRSWQPFNEITFQDGIRELNDLYFRQLSDVQVILPPSVEEVSGDTFFSTGRKISFTFPNMDAAKIEDGALRTWRSNRWREQGRCPACGGNWKGLFKKVCDGCGREKPKA